MIVADIDEEAANTMAEEVRALGRKGMAIYCDMSILTDVKDLFSQVDQHFVRVDILANVPYALPRPTVPSVCLLSRNMGRAMVLVFE